MGVDAQMFARVPEPMTAEAVRTLSADLVEAFGTDRLFLLPPWSQHRWSEPRHALEIIEVYTQDGDDILPRDGEQLIEVHLGGRYYGPGYERGDWPTVDGICEWLLRRLPSESEVWYGGDSSGICAKHMTLEFRRDMWAHFAKHGHTPYTACFNRGGTVRRCEFCGNRPMDHYGSGSGGRYTAFRCDGCGLHEVTRDGGETWTRGTYADMERERRNRQATVV